MLKEKKEKNHLSGVNVIFGSVSKANCGLDIDTWTQNAGASHLWQFLEEVLPPPFSMVGGCDLSSDIWIERFMDGFKFFSKDANIHSSKITCITVCKTEKHPILILVGRESTLQGVRNSEKCLNYRLVAMGLLRGGLRGWGLAFLKILFIIW